MPTATGICERRKRKEARSVKGDERRGGEGSGGGGREKPKGSELALSYDLGSSARA